MGPEEVQAGEIMLAAVAPFVVGIFTKRVLAQPDWTFATGTPIEFRGRKLLVTAAHVVSEHPGDQPADMVFLPPPPEGFTISTALAGGRYPQSERWDTTEIVGDRQTDLAAIHFREPPPIAFFPIPDTLTLPIMPGTPVAICGYPKAKARVVQIGAIVTDLALPDFQGATVVDSSTRGLQPFQFAIDYPKAPGVVLPGGYSGAMVWYDKAGARTVEQLQRELILGVAGVVTDHDPAHEVLWCSDANAILKLLRQIC